MPRPEFNPMFFGGDLIFSVIIIVLCLLIFFKTKELFKLTKHKGINYFRNTFLLLAVAYIIRLVFSPFIFPKNLIGFQAVRHTLMPVSLVFMSYFSTMAMFSLFLSTSWKKVKIKNAYLFASIIALVVSFVAFFSREPLILILTQLALLILTVIFCFATRKESKKLSKLLTIYILLFFFWIFNLLPLSTRRLFPHEFMFPGQIISLIIFIIIFFKVRRWVK